VARKKRRRRTDTCSKGKSGPKKERDFLRHTIVLGGKSGRRNFKTRKKPKRGIFPGKTQKKMFSHWLGTKFETT